MDVDVDEVTRLMVRVNAISYDLEYRRNLDFALAKLGYGKKEAERFASEATNEQKQIDADMARRIRTETYVAKQVARYLSRKDALLKQRASNAKIPKDEMRSLLERLRKLAIV